MLGDVVVVFESSPCSWLDLWPVILSRAACLSDIVGYWKGVVDSQAAQDCLFCCTLEYTGMLALHECPSLIFNQGIRFIWDIKINSGLRVHDYLFFKCGTLSEKGQ